MHPFADTTAVENLLAELNDSGEPLVVKLPRQPGQKEQRYAHLFSGPPDIHESVDEPPPESARIKVAEEDEKISRLEQELSALRAEFDQFREQFD